MAGFGIKTPWTSQPKYPVAIDRSNSIGASVASAWLCNISPTGYAFDAARVANLAYSSGSYRASAMGVGIDTPNTTTGNKAFVTTTYPQLNGIATYTEGTIVWVGHWDGTSGNGPQGAMGIVGSATSGMGLAYRTTPQKWCFKVTGNELQGSVYTTAGPLVLIGRYSPSYMDLFANGTSLGSTTTGVPANINYPTNINLNGSDVSHVFTSVYDNNGQVTMAMWIPRALTNGEIKSLSVNPWQIFQPIERRTWVPSAGGGVTGTLAVTLENFTSSISGTTTVVGTIANTLDNFTSAIQGTPTIVGTIAQTMSDFTSTMSGSAGGVEGTIAQTLENFTSSITGTTTVTGTMNTVLDNFTSSINGTTTIVGTIAVTLENFISGISGTVGAVVDEIVSRLTHLRRFIGRR